MSRPLTSLSSSDSSFPAALGFLDTSARLSGATSSLPTLRRPPPHHCPSVSTDSGFKEERSQVSSPFPAPSVEPRWTCCQARGYVRLYSWLSLHNPQRNSLQADEQVADWITNPSILSFLQTQIEYDRELSRTQPLPYTDNNRHNKVQRIDTANSHHASRDTTGKRSHKGGLDPFTDSAQFFNFFCVWHNSKC